MLAVDLETVKRLRPFKIVQSFLRDGNVGLGQNRAASETWDRISFDVFKAARNSGRTIRRLSALSKDVWSLAAAITYDADHLFKVVTQSNEITSTTKALLVARALVEDVEITKTALDKCCAIVVRTLEFFMQGMTIDESAYSKKIIDDTSLWSLILSSSTSSLTDTVRGLQLRQLLRLIYKCRSGPAKESLVDLLSQSKIQAISALSSVFDVEGEFVDRTIQSDSAETLVISINRPSPELEE